MATNISEEQRVHGIAIQSISNHDVKQLLPKERSDTLGTIHRKVREAHHGKITACLKEMESKGQGLILEEYLKCQSIAVI